MQKKLALFFLTHFTYGMAFNMFGPLIPYLSEASHVIESQFTFIFILRGIAYLIAGFCQQSFLKVYDLYKRMLISCVVSGISFFLFLSCYHLRWIASIVCLIMFLANGSMEVLINVLLMTASTTDNAKKAISFSYGFYGVGGVMGSLIVAMLGTKALIFSAFWTVGVGMMYFDLIADKQTQKQKSFLKQPMLNPSTETIQIPAKDSTYLSHNLQMNFCILFCIYAAISLSYRSWLPSFIVMQNFATKEMAALSVSIYSGVLTIFRFVYMLFNPNIIKSLFYSSEILILILFISTASFFLGIQMILIYGSSIILGMIFSSYVPYLYALPSEYNMTFTEKGTCNTIIAYAIGQAVITALIGCLMEWIHPIMLFVSMFGFAIINNWYLRKTVDQMDKQEKQRLNPEEEEMF